MITFILWQRCLRSRIQGFKNYPNHGQVNGECYSWQSIFSYKILHSYSMNIISNFLLSLVQFPKNCPFLYSRYACTIAQQLVCLAYFYRQSTLEVKPTWNQAFMPLKAVPTVVKCLNSHKPLLPCIIYYIV